MDGGHTYIWMRNVKKPVMEIVTCGGTLSGRRAMGWGKRTLTGLQKRVRGRCGTPCSNGVHTSQCSEWHLGC